MRIALVSSYAVQCGIATYTDALGAALHARGHDVRVFAMDLDAAAHYCGGMSLPYSRCWSRGGNYTPLEHRLAEFSPDVVHVQHEYGLHHDLGNFSAWLMSVEQPLVITLHTVPIPGHAQAKSLNWMMAVTRRTGGVAIAHQPDGVMALHAYGIKRAHHIPHGSGGPYEPVQRLTARQRLCLPENEVIFVTPGFWTMGKRNDMTILAFVKLRERGLIPRGTVLVIAGQPIGEDSSEDQRLWCERVEKAGLQDVIQIRPGYIDDAFLGTYFGAADVVIANSGPTMYSTSGRGHLAMSYGACVLAADVPLLAEFHDCGMMFKSQAQLENAMAKLAHDRWLRREFSQKALAHVERTSWEKVAIRHEAVYKEAVQ